MEFIEDRIIASFDDIEAFAEELRKVACEYMSCHLKDYSNNLCEQAQNYDIEEVEKMIKDFPGIVKILKEKINNKAIC